MIRKTAFFEGWSWFKFNNLGLTLGTNLEIVPTFVEVTGKKLVAGPLKNLKKKKKIIKKYIVYISATCHTILKTNFLNFAKSFVKKN